MRYSCIICLSNAYNVNFFSICNHCNNCFICQTCYKKSDTHKLNMCPMCRQPLFKINVNDTCTNIYTTIYFLRYFLIYILFVLTPSNIIVSGIKNNLECSTIYITNYQFFLVIINICNLIIIPSIIFFYKNYYKFILVLYSCFNILFLGMYISKADTPQIFYSVYTMMYVYCSVFIHLFFILFLNMYSCIQTYIDDFIDKEQLFVLKTFNTVKNNRNRRFSVTPF